MGSERIQHVADSVGATLAWKIAATEDAPKVGVFGAPTSIIDGEVYWGQNRLNFVAKALQR